MYDRDAKVHALRARVSPEDRAAHTLIHALDSCRSTTEFSQSMKLQMSIVRDILQSAFNDMNTIAVDSSDDDDDDNDVPPAKRKRADRNDGNEPPAKKLRRDESSTSSSSSSQPPDYDALLRLSIDQLKTIVSFIDRDSNYFDHCLQLNNEMQQLIGLHDATSSTTTIPSYVINSSDVMTFVVRDMLTSTGTQTHVMFLFVIRVTTIIIFLIVNFVRNSSVSSVQADDENDVTMEDVSVEGFYDDATSAVAATFPPVMTIDNFVATFVINMIRECFATYLDWPVKLLAHNDITISFPTIKHTVVHDLSRIRGGSSSSWIRVLRGKLYINDSALLGFFEEFSTAVQSSGGASAAGSADATFENTMQIANPMNRDRPARMTRQMYNRYDEFMTNINCCKNAICTATKISSDWKCVSDDCSLLILFAVLACLDDRLASNDGESSPSSCRLTATLQNERELLPSVNEAINARDKSYFAVMQAVYFRLMSSTRITRHQIEQFIDCMIELWNERIGICDMNHLTLTFTRLMHIFPTLARTENA